MANSQTLNFQGGILHPLPASMRYQGRREGKRTREGCPLILLLFSKEQNRPGLQVSSQLSPTWGGGGFIHPEVPVRPLALPKRTLAFFYAVDCQSVSVAPRDLACKMIRNPEPRRRLQPSIPCSPALTKAWRCDVTLKEHRPENVLRARDPCPGLLPSETRVWRTTQLHPSEEQVSSHFCLLWYPQL